MVADVRPVFTRRAGILATIVIVAFAGIVWVRPDLLKSPKRDVAAPSRGTRVLDDRSLLIRDPRPVKLIPRRLYSQPMPFTVR